MIRLLLTLNGAGALICGSIAILLYLNTLDCGLCYDDKSAIITNGDITSRAPWTNLLWNDFWGTPMSSKDSHKSYRPLCVASFRLNYLIHELEPMGYHLVNVLLHGAVCYLYVQLCGIIFSDVWLALIAGLLFAVHPIHTEAVAGLVGRAELLSAVFFILSLFCYRRTLYSKRGSIWFCLSLMFCLLSVLSKEQGITVVAVCVAYNVFIYQELNFKRALAILSTILKKKRLTPSITKLLLHTFLLMGFVIVLLALRLRVLMKGTLPTFIPQDNPAVMLAAPYRQLHWLYLSFVNAWLLLNPSLICADWSMGSLPLIRSLTDIRNLATVVTLTGTAVLGLHGLSSGEEKTKSSLLFALSLIVFPYIPASNLFFPVGFVVAERVLYLPSMGFCMLVALGCWKIMKQGKVARNLVKFLLCVLLLSHSVKTVMRNRDWYSNMSLFSSGVKINPSNAKILSNLCNQYEIVRNLSFAEIVCREAVEVQPDYIVAVNNLGNILVHRGMNAEAEEVFQNGIKEARKIKLVPSQAYIGLYYGLANAIREDPTRLQETEDIYRKALTHEPNSVDVLVNLGGVLMKKNQTDEALSSFNKALEINPHSFEVQYNLALLYTQRGEKTEAEKWYRKAVALRKNNIASLLGLAVLLHESVELDKMKEAETLLLHILKQDPVHERANMQLGLLYMNLQKNTWAADVFMKTVQTNPSHQGALYNLGVVYYNSEKYEEAQTWLSQLMDLDPNDIKGLQLLGECYLKMHKHQQAEEAFKAVLDHTPTVPPFAEVSSNLGEVYNEMGDMTNAEWYYRDALSVDTDHTLTKFRLAYLIVRTGNLDKYKEAEKLLLDVLSAEPDNPNAIMCLGLVYYGVSNLAKARESFRRTLEVHPTNQGALYNLGAVLAEEGNYAEATIPLSKLLELNPRHFKAANQLGMCYRKINEKQKAKEVYEAVLAKDPTNTITLNNLGILLIEQNEIEKAVTIFTQLTELDPSNESAKRQLTILHQYKKGGSSA